MTLSLRGHRSRCAALLATTFLTACPGPEPDPELRDAERAPEDVVDMGPLPDVPAQPLGELCHVKVQVSSDTAGAVPTLEAFDLTAGQPLTILDRSSPGNHYFDAPLGHEVEFTVLPGAGRPVAPLTYRATIDPRCASIGDLEFFTPLGLTLEAVDRDTFVDDLPPVFFDAASGVMLVRGIEQWRAVETTDNQSFAVAVAEVDTAVAQLPPDVRFRALSQGFLLAEGPAEVTVISAGGGEVTPASTESIPTPLADVRLVDESRAIVHAADGSVWDIAWNDDVSWTAVSETAQLAVTASGDAIWLLDPSGVVRRAAFGGAPVEVGTLAGAARITVNASGTRLLGWFGDSCVPWEDRCEVALLDATDLQTIDDANGDPVGAEFVLAATSVDDAFVLANAPSTVQLLHIEEDQLVEGEVLQGAPDAERSTVLPQALVIVTDHQTTFARSSTASPAFEEGSWRIVPPTGDTIELVQEPCEDPLACERVLWFADLRGRATQPGSTLTLGANREIEPQASGDAYQSIDFVRDEEHRPTSNSVTIEPLFVPSGAPCLPIVDTTVAAERFTTVAKGLHCITWWNP